MRPRAWSIKEKLMNWTSSKPNTFALWKTLLREKKPRLPTGLWCGPAAVAPIPPLAWEPPYVAGAPPSKKKNGDIWQKTIQPQKNNHLLIYSTWMNLRGILLSERNQFSIIYMLRNFICMRFCKRWHCRHKEWISGCKTLRVRESLTTKG